MEDTPIYKVDKINCNYIYMKREDFIPFSFGGNKARKAILFLDEIKKGQYDYILTYGSSHSNHCRIIANMAASNNISCIIVAPYEVCDITFNSRLMELFEAKIIPVHVENVHSTIEVILKKLRMEGHSPYFIPGGGHGNIGTKAYIQCYDEIRAYEKEQKVHFDYIFFASGTGTTQAGLVCGQILNGDSRQIIGISIARKNPRGRNVVIDSIQEYLECVGVKAEDIQNKTIFVDDYAGAGYGKDSEVVLTIIKDTMLKYGIPLDSTYTGKAFYGMKQYLLDNKIVDKKVLFIHTGGTPLFFDDINKLER